MKARDYVTTLKGYQDMIAQAVSNADLSETGRRKRVTEYRTAIDQHAGRALADLEIEYKQARAEAEQAEQAVSAAVEKWAAGWDYARLNFAQETIKAQISRARDLDEIRQAYKAAQGDNYKVRAWSEIGVSMIEGRGDIEAGGFIADVKRAGQALANTPEVQQARRAGEATAQKVLDLRRDTLTIADVLQGAGHGFTAMKAEQLAGSVNVSAKHNGDGYEYSVSFVDAPETSQA